MGAYAPAPIVTPAVHERVMREIVEPTLAGMAAEGAPFRGVLFVGLMIDRGDPQVLEYNVRFGDPEATVLVPTYGGDWFELLDSAARGELPRAAAAPPSRRCALRRDGGSGISGRPARRRPDRGLDAALPPGAFVFHAGTRRGSDGSFVTSGGRVLAVGASAVTLEDAARLAYEAVARIRWDGEHHRSDIGRRALPKAAASEESADEVEVATNRTSRTPMAEIAPLTPLRYDLVSPEGWARSVVAPPYDVISPEQRAALAARDPHNVVRLILPEGEGDASTRMPRSSSGGGAPRGCSFATRSRGSTATTRPSAPPGQRPGARPRSAGGSWRSCASCPSRSASCCRTSGRSPAPRKIG